MTYYSFRSKLTQTLRATITCAIYSCSAGTSFQLLARTKANVRLRCCCCCCSSLKLFAGHARDKGRERRETNVKSKRKAWEISQGGRMIGKEGVEHAATICFLSFPPAVTTSALPLCHSRGCGEKNRTDTAWTGPSAQREKHTQREIELESRIFTDRRFCIPEKIIFQDQVQVGRYQV